MSWRLSGRDTRAADLVRGRELDVLRGQLLQLGFAARAAPGRRLFRLALRQRVLGGRCGRQLDSR